MLEASNQVALGSTGKGAAKNIADAAVVALSAKMTSEILKKIASPFTQESASPVDYLMALVHDYGPPKLPVYSKKLKA